MSEDNCNQKEKKLQDNEAGTSSSSQQESVPSGSSGNDPNEDLYGDDEILTVQDLQRMNEEEEHRQEESDAVLGACIEQCTFDFGYMPRQALYACKTCPMKVDPSVPGGTTKYLAGFCYGCSIACHEGHDLVELYTKRNFRCDCGSDRFEGLKCQITDKTGVNNDENAYNHNFTGLYCTCNRPYPVPDDPDTQMQCAICEDWFHSAHLKVPEKNNADEIICMLCASKCKFLVYYIEAGLINLVPPVPVESIEEPGSPSSGEQAEAEVLPKVEIVGCKLDHCKKLYIEKHGSEDVPESSCNSTLLLDKSYRGQLCQCEKCLELYNQLKIDFIISQEDMLYYFERKNLEEADNRYRRELDKIDHVTKMTAIEGYKTLKRKLEEFLNSFRNGEIVSTERALEFCQQLDSERHKRRR